MSKGKKNKNKKGNKKVIIIVSIIAVIIVVGIVIGIVIANKGVKPKYDKSNQPIYVNEESRNNIYSNADSFKGQFIDVKGKVFNVRKEDGMTILQINEAGNESLTNNIIIGYKGDLNIKNDAFIKATGYIIGITEYENALGGKMRAPTIMATNIEESNYIEVVSPTIKEVNYTDKVIDQKGYEIKISKIEFAKNETRVYVEATNNTKKDFDIYTYSAVATQNGKQFSIKTNYEADYTELSAELKPGMTSRGIITFEPIEQETFNVIIEGSSEDWNIELNEYNFTLEVE